MSNVTPIKKSSAPADAVWLSEEETAARIPGMTVVNLKALRTRRQGPPYYKPTRAAVYLQSEVDAWVASHRIETGGA